MNRFPRSLLRHSLKTIAVASLCVALLGASGALADYRDVDTAQTESIPRSVAYGLGSVLGTALYAPFKITYAAVGSLVGGMAWLVSGGNNAVAEPVIGPAVRGTYVLTPAELRNPRRVVFIGPSDSSRLVAQRGRELTPMVSAAGAVDCDALGEIATLYFSLGSKALSASSQTALDRAASVLSTCPDQLVEVQGYADAVGAPEQNMVLSRERAERVAARLREKGIAGERLDARGYGEFGAADGDAEDRARNRRVVISVRGTEMLRSGVRHSQR